MNWYSFKISSLPKKHYKIKKQTIGYEKMSATCISDKEFIAGKYKEFHKSQEEKQNPFFNGQKNVNEHLTKEVCKWPTKHMKRAQHYCG